MLYATDAESPWGEGIPVTTQSMMRTFLQCPREAYYKYVLRLKPKVLTKPLTRGKWIHSLLENYYRTLAEDGSPEEARAKLEETHAHWCGRFAKLFDEEKEKLGDLPREIKPIIDSYFWHYGDPQYKDWTDWKVHEVEMTIEAALPNDHIFRGRLDMLIENQFGIWLVDHKTHKRLPDWTHRMMDLQAPLYIWAAREQGIPVSGFIWNYICMADRPVPQVIKDGSRFSKTGWNTDYLIAARAIKDAGWVKNGKIEVPGNEAHTAELKGYLRQLKSQRWKPDGVDISPFYRRDILTYSDEQIGRVIASACITSDRMHSYDFDTEDQIERNPPECKGWKCAYQSLSIADLVTGDSERLKAQEYRIGDPLAYYEDEEA